MVVRDTHFFELFALSFSSYIIGRVESGVCGSDQPQAAGSPDLEAIETTGRSSILRCFDEVSDGELVERLRGGEPWAAEALYRRHVGPLLSLTTKLLSSKLDAEDVVQDTFVTAFERLGQVRDPEAVGFWLQRVAIRHVHARYRRRAFKRALGLVSLSSEVESLESLASDDAPPDICAEIALMSQALERIPAKERVAWVLRHLEGRSLAEVAELVGCSLATVKRRISKAECRVERRLDEVSHG